MRVAIYARYSSDNQRDASIADQIRICRTFAQRERWTIADEFHDHAISGATLLRPGFQALMRRAFDREFDVVLAESLDRFSRDQEDTALPRAKSPTSTSRVLHALQEKLLRRDLFEEFCQEFTRETKRLRMAARASLTATEQELGRVQAQITKLVQALKDGVPASIVKDDLIALEAQQVDLRKRLDRASEPDDRKY